MMFSLLYMYLWFVISCLLRESLCCCYVCVFFFFNQKTAYEMRISDWSSDVCSSDLLGVFRKDVSDFVVPLVLDVTREVNGEQVLIQPYSTVANGSNARSQGVEVYAQHTLDFGLGAQVNFTYNDTSVADITLDRSEEHTSELQSLMRISYAVFC